MKYSSFYLILSLLIGFTPDSLSQRMKMEELSEFLVPGSFLEPSGGAAAIFESKEWTDYIRQAFQKK